MFIMRTKIFGQPEEMRNDGSCRFETRQTSGLVNQRQRGQSDGTRRADTLVTEFREQLSGPRRANMLVKFREKPQRGQRDDGRNRRLNTKRARVLVDHERMEPCLEGPSHSVSNETGRTMSFVDEFQGKTNRRQSSTRDETDITSRRTEQRPDSQGGTNEIVCRRASRRSTKRETARRRRSSSRDGTSNDARRPERNKATLGSTEARCVDRTSRRKNVESRPPRP